MITTGSVRHAEIGLAGTTKGLTVSALTILYAWNALLQNRNKAMKTLLAITLLTISSTASASCKWAWVDDDYKTQTPAVRKWVCSDFRQPKVPDAPSVRPIQTPQVRPMNTPSVPMIGTTSCRTQSVYKNGTWVTVEVCE